MVFETQRAAPFTGAEPKSQVARKMPPPPTAPAPAARAVSALAGIEATVLSTGETPITFLVIEKCSKSENVGQKLTIVEYPFMLGRALPPLSDEKEISRKHAEITYDIQIKKFYITDLNSSNGVIVNGIPIRPGEPAEIKPGTSLGLGQVVVLQFEG